MPESSLTDRKLNVRATTRQNENYGTLSQDPAKDEPEGFMECAAPYLAEFIGTFLIVFAMACCSISGLPMWSPTGVAFVVVVAIYSFACISGAHLNPAVTLSLFFTFKFPWMRTVGYILAQVFGGFAGILLCGGIFAQTLNLGPPESSQFRWYDVGFVEALYTFMISFVFMNCVTSVRNNKADDQNHFFALATGFVYIAGGYPSLRISGSLFNPAASLAIGVTSHKFVWTLVYVVAQAAGAWIASLVFAMVRPEEFKLQYDGSIEDFEVPLRSKLMSELIGTFMIVVTVGLNLVMVSPAGPWSSAACYTSLIYSLRDVSGGHFNPAVTLAVMLSRRDKCSFALGQSFIVHQLLGGLAAGFVYARYDIVASGVILPLVPMPGYGWAQAGMAEVLFTAILAWVFLAVATTVMPPSITETNFYFGFAVGSCVTIGGYAIGHISGGTLNPAVAFGRVVAQVIRSANILKVGPQWWRLVHCVYYGLFELGGGILAAVLFSLTHQKEYMIDDTGLPHIP